MYKTKNKLTYHDSVVRCRYGRSMCTAMCDPYVFTTYIDEITTQTRMASNVYVFLVVGSFHKIKVVVVHKRNCTTKNALW